MFLFGVTSAGLQACCITDLPCGRDGFPATGVLKHQGGLRWKRGQAEKLRKGRPWDESRAPGRSQRWGGGRGGEGGRGDWKGKSGSCGGMILSQLYFFRLICVALI